MSVGSDLISDERPTTQPKSARCLGSLAAGETGEASRTDSSSVRGKEGEDRRGDSRRKSPLPTPYKSATDAPSQPASLAQSSELESSRPGSSELPAEQEELLLLLPKTKPKATRREGEREREENEVSSG